MISLLLIGMILLVVGVSVLLLAKKCWHWYKSTTYSRDEFLSDLVLFSTICVISIVFLTFTPASELICFTKEQQNLVRVFRIIPALFVGIAILGLLSTRDKISLKYILSLLYIGLLLFGIILTIEELEPCTEFKLFESIETPNLNIEALIYKVALVITIIASLITIGTFIVKKRKKHLNAQEKKSSKNSNK